MVEEKTNESVFDAVDKSEAIPEQQEPVQSEECKPTEKEIEEAISENEEDFVIGDLSDEDSYDIKLSESDEGKVFEIERVENRPPKTKDEKGTIAPIVSKNGKSYYQGKMRVYYVGTTYVSIVPNVKWYVSLNSDSGKKQLNPWFLQAIDESKLTDNFTPEISKVYFKFCQKFGHEVGKLSQAQFVTELVGKKVKLTTTSGEYNGKPWSRIDLQEFE